MKLVRHVSALEDATLILNSKHETLLSLEKPIC